MLRKFRPFIYVVATSALAAACATTPPPEEHHVSLPSSAGVYKVGNPYQIGDTWYYPREQPNYDETGIASWYGPTFYGHRTANGEMYDASAMTAAHRTLPMPVNVRVTNLENGKSVVVRVNDRGPYAKGRIIDLSEAAARALDVVRTGTARVRVTYLAPAEGTNGVPLSTTPTEVASAVTAAPTEKVDTSALNVLPGATVAPASPPPEAMPAPAPASSLPPAMADQQPDGVVTHVPVPAVTRLYVQVGAFSSPANANRLKEHLGGDNMTVSAIDRGGKTLYRVRSGPYDDVASADAALARLNGLGSNDAQIVVDK